MVWGASSASGRLPSGRTSVAGRLSELPLIRFALLACFRWCPSRIRSLTRSSRLPGNVSNRLPCASLRRMNERGGIRTRSVSASSESFPKKVHSTVPVLRVSIFPKVNVVVILSPMAGKLTTTMLNKQITRHPYLCFIVFPSLFG